MFDRLMENMHINQGCNFSLDQLIYFLFWGEVTVNQIIHKLFGPWFHKGRNQKMVITIHTVGMLKTLPPQKKK